MPLSLERPPRWRLAASEVGISAGISQPRAALPATGLSLIKQPMPGENAAGCKPPDRGCDEAPDGDIEASPPRRAPRRIDVVMPRPSAEHTSSLLARRRGASILPVSRTEIALLRAHLGPAIDAILFDGEKP